VVAQVYSALYPKLLTNTFNVSQQGIASVAIDINQSPTVSLTQSEAAKHYFEESLDSNVHGPTSALAPALRAKLVALATAATFDASAPSVALTVNYTNGATPTHVSASLSATLSIQGSVQGSQNILTVQVIQATLTIPSNPALAEILNNAFVPTFLVPYINTSLLGPIQVPTLGFSSFQVSMPAIAVQSPYVTAYSALGSTQPDVPPPSNWPTGCIFVAVDDAVLQSAAGTVFPLGPSTGFSWEIVSGQVGAQVLPPTFVINSDGSITATMTANASAQLTLHTPDSLPNVNFGPSATATLTATVLPSVSNGALQISLEGIAIPTFSFDWGIPSWINWLFDPLEDGLAAALNALLGPLLGNVLKFPPITVYTLPTISFVFSGSTINITITNAKTSSQNSLLVVQAQTTISSAASTIDRFLAGATSIRKDAQCRPVAVGHATSGCAKGFSYTGDYGEAYAQALAWVTANSQPPIKLTPQPTQQWINLGGQKALAVTIDFVVENS
jgi:hypothetical protein